MQPAIFRGIMRSLSRVRISLGSIVLALACGNSVAAVGIQTEAHLGNLNYAITLDNGSSVAPVFTVEWSSVYGSLSSGQPFYEQDDYLSNADGSPLTLSFAFQGGISSVSKLDQVGTLNAATLTPTGQPQNWNGGAFNRMDANNAFILPAHASFSLSGLASGLVDQQDLTRGYEGKAEIGIDLYHSWDNVASYGNVVSVGQFPTATQQFSDTFSLGYTNDSSQDMTLHLRVRGTAFGSTYTAPTVPSVPEPATYGMLAGGLLLLGAVARRKGKQA